MINYANFILYKDKQKEFFRQIKVDEIIDTRTIFNDNNDVYEFFVNNESCYFSKSNFDFIFTINIKNGIKSIKYELKQLKAKFDINFDYLDYSFDKDKISIKYRIETDDVDNEIIIERGGSHES